MKKLPIDTMIISKYIMLNIYKVKNNSFPPIKTAVSLPQPNEG
jgi:hypothetical protein